MNAKHLAQSVEWFTPEPIVTCARAALGGRIDLDPASCVEANQTIHATAIYTKEQSALTLDRWSAERVFLNPPGGRGVVRKFWDTLIQSYLAGMVKRAIWIGYSLEQLQTLQTKGGISPVQWPICIPDKRIHFIGAGNSPTHANYITALGIPAGVFAGYFSVLGQCADGRSNRPSPRVS